MLQLVSGQTAILGGLIKDEVRRNRNQIPGCRQYRARATCSRSGTNRPSRRELVIFLRPTVVTNPSLDADDLRFLRPLLPKPEQMGALPGAPGATK